MTTDKQQLQQQVTDMKTKLAEMEALLNKLKPIINYWQPNVKEYESYYFINQLGNIKEECANDNSVKRYRVFKTETEAQKYADYIKAEETLRKAIAEANEGWLPDWYNSNDNKLYVYINKNNLGIEQNNWEKVIPTFMYIKSAELTRQLIKDYKQEFITYLSY